MFLEMLRDSPMSFVMIHVYSPLSSRLRFVRIRLACVETTVPSGPRHSSEVMGSESAWRHLSSSVGSLSLTRMGSISGVILGGFSAAEREREGGREKTLMCTCIQHTYEVKIMHYNILDPQNSYSLCEKYILTSQCDEQGVVCIGSKRLANESRGSVCNAV